MPGTLYLIPNTLGTIDAGKRDPAALEFALPAGVRGIAARLDYFVAEHAKTVRAYLKAIGTLAPIQDIEIRELNTHTPAGAVEELLAPLLAGRDAGLVSEAGCPAVADPGAELVRLAHARRVPVRPLVGPSAILLTVMGSGLNGQSFAFVGYLPTDAGERARRIKELEERSRREHQTQVFIETPYRNPALLEALAAQLHADTEVCVAADLSLNTEQIETLPARQWRGRGAQFHKRPAVFALLAR